METEEKKSGVKLYSMGWMLLTMFAMEAAAGTAVAGTAEVALASGGAAAAAAGTTTAAAGTATAAGTVTAVAGMGVATKIGAVFWLWHWPLAVSSVAQGWCENGKKSRWCPK